MTLTIKTTGLEDYLDPAGGQAWVQCLIIGGHGVGKTPFAGKWPKPIFAMAEHGTMSIAKDRLPYAEIFSDADMDAFIAAVRRDALLPLDKRQYLTVVLDTVDAYQKRLMDHRVTSQGLDRFTGWDNWDWLDAKVSRALRQLSNLPVHLVVNMHYKDQFVGEGDDKTVVKEARLKGDAKTSIYQEFDLIGFMETHYVMETGTRVRKHRIRWWPEPGYEMVRSRAVGSDGVLLPQFTPVEFAPRDFQLIFDCIVAGVDELEESKVVEEVETQADVDAASLPAPDEGAGPVTQPNLPPAQKEKVPPIKELMERVGDDPVKAAEMLAWEERRESPRPSFVRDLKRIIDKSAASEAAQAPAETSSPVEAGEAPVAEAPPASDTPPEPPAPEPGSAGDVEPAAEPDAGPPPAPAPESAPEPPEQETAQNGVGSAEVPLVMLEDQLNRLDGPKYAVLVHVHSPEGKCLKGKQFHEVADEAGEPVTAAAAAEEAQLHPAPAEPPATGPAQPAAAPAPAGGDHCGDQPQSMIEKGFPAQPGCGRPITPSNKAPLAVVKYKTYLCTDCFAAAVPA